MTIETMEKVLTLAKGMASLEQAIWFGSIFVWGIGFYVLYQLYHLKFLKVLVWSEVTGLAFWFWINRFYFAPNFMIVTDNSPNGQVVFIAMLDMIIRLTPLILGTTGAVMGLHHVKKIWKEKQIANQALEPTSLDAD